jgi:hypothetical protein
MNIVPKCLTGEGKILENGQLCKIYSEMPETDLIEKIKSRVLEIYESVSTYEFNKTLFTELSEFVSVIHKNKNLNTLYSVKVCIQYSKIKEIDVIIETLPSIKELGTEVKWLNRKHLSELDRGHYLFFIPDLWGEKYILKPVSGYLAKNISVIGGKFANDYQEDLVMGYIKIDVEEISNKVSSNLFKGR